MSKPATSAPAPLPTRRQLDELEALLQRMLALPVQQVDSPENEEQSPESSNQMTHEDVTEPAVGDVSPELAAAVRAQWEPARESPLNLPEHVPIEKNPLWENSEHRANAAVPNPTNSERAPATSRNSAMLSDDGATAPVRAEPGIFRILLGWSGLVCLILSLAILLLDWFGWTW